MTPHPDDTRTLRYLFQQACVSERHDELGRLRAEVHLWRMRMREVYRKVQTLEQVANGADTSRIVDDIQCWTGILMGLMRPFFQASEPSELNPGPPTHAASDVAQGWRCTEEAAREAVRVLNESDRFRWGRHNSDQPRYELVLLNMLNQTVVVRTQDGVEFAVPYSWYHFPGTREEETLTEFLSKLQIHLDPTEEIS